MAYDTALERFPTLRQSSLAAFDACGLSALFDMAYREDWSSAPAARGQLFHRFAARALSEMQAQGEGKLEVDVALAIFHEVLRMADQEEDFATIPMAQVRDLHWVVRKWAYDNTFSVEHLVDVENRLEATLRYPKPEGGFQDRILTGQLDSLFISGAEMEQAIVLDWKDTWSLPAPTEISFEGYFQQRFYAWLIFRNYSTVSRVTMREFYVRYSEPREATIYRDDVDNIEQELSAAAERFDRAVQREHERKTDKKLRRLFVPSPGKHCSYCPRPTACPIFPEARGEGRIDSETQAEVVAGRVVVAKAALAQSQKALKAWADTHGDIPIKDAKNNRVYGYKLSTRTNRPTFEAMEREIEAAEAEGRPPDFGKLWVTKAQTSFTDFVPKPEPTPDDDLYGSLGFVE